MLRLMRDYATSWFIKIILGAIVIVFVLWGVGNYGDQRQNQIALVNGEPITVEEYRTAYNNLLERYRQMYGENFNDDILKMLDLENQAINSLIEQRLLLQEAKRLEFRVTDEELAEAIRTMPVFQQDGRFSNRIYQAVLSQNRLTPETFEVLQRQSMLTEKIRSFITGNVKVSELETREWFHWNNSQVKIDYVLFDPAAYEDVEPAEEALHSYYEKNKEKYKSEPKVKARYVRIDPEIFTDRVTVTDEEILADYEENIEEFRTEKSVSARHILLKTEPDESEESVEEKRKKALEIMEKAKAGEDFAELARTHSEGPTKENGGDLGEFKQGDMVKPFSDTAFSMAPGQISEPVKTQFGWHVIKVEKVNEASTKTVEEATETIREKLTQQRAKTLAYEAAENLYDATFEGDNLAEIAKMHNLEPAETDPFTRQGPGAEKITDKRGFARAAFELQENGISDIIDLNDAYYLIQVTEKLPAQVEEYDAVKEKVKSDLTRELREEKAKEAADAFAAQITKEGSTLADAAGELEVKTTDFFKRTGAIPEIGYEQEITKAAFQLTRENPYPDSPLKSRKGYYIIALKEKKLPEAEEFENQKDSVEKQLLRQKEFKTLEKWIAQLRESSEIEQYTD